MCSDTTVLTIAAFFVLGAISSAAGIGAFLSFYIHFDRLREEKKRGQA